ncbi:Bcl-2-like protein [Vombatid gammaherpesvirus 1]|uniref:Bcl-2-like protein n=1 Tax=Vombatid gammaherpesvirus 1 TaxID=2052651 RepID=A0A3Q8J5Z0_9GAMA|nr:Bcl-2-like protein [Vombatid gammaherpesvirus 1]AZB49115.1 Bcl-2-like protein [Vombatid gammaherpesvirus 1]
MEFYLDDAFSNNLEFWDRYPILLTLCDDYTYSTEKESSLTANELVLLQQLRKINCGVLADILSGPHWPLHIDDPISTCDLVVEELFEDRVNIGRFMVFFLMGMYAYKKLTETGRKDTAQRLKVLWADKYATHRHRLKDSRPKKTSIPGIIVSLSFFCLAAVGLRYLAQ